MEGVVVVAVTIANDTGGTKRTCPPTAAVKPALPPLMPSRGLIIRRFDTVCRDERR